eukprot:scaffold647843_cov52-Prasinocladus_malaysianus.AAC.2
MLAEYSESQAPGSEPDSAMLEAARTAVATAMVSILPGVDANDPPKTLACFRFFCSVLSSIGCLSGAPDAPGASSCPLPLDLEDWLDELLAILL